MKESSRVLIKIRIKPRVCTLSIFNTWSVSWCSKKREGNKCVQGGKEEHQQEKVFLLMQLPGHYDVNCSIHPSSPWYLKPLKPGTQIMMFSLSCFCQPFQRSGKSPSMHACAHLCPMYIGMTMEASGGCLMSCSPSYKYVCPMWVLGIKLRSSGRAGIILNHRIIAPDPPVLLLMTLPGAGHSNLI